MFNCTCVPKKKKKLKKLIVKEEAKPTEFKLPLYSGEKDEQIFFNVDRPEFHSLGLDEKSDIINAICQNNNLKYLQKILNSKQWDVNETLNILRTSGQRIEMSALHLAVILGWQEGTIALLDEGADINARCEWTGQLGALFHNECCVYSYCSYAFVNGTCNKTQHTPLCFIVNMIDLKMTEILLDHGADPNACAALGGILGDNGDTKEAKAKIFKALLHAGADPNLKPNHIGLTVLHKLVGGPMKTDFQQNLLDVLFQYGVDMEVWHTKGNALDYAIAENSCLNNIIWLVRHGARTTVCPYARLKSRYFWVHILPYLLYMGLKPLPDLHNHLAKIKEGYEKCSRGEHYDHRDCGDSYLPYVEYEGYVDRAIGMDWNIQRKTAIKIPTQLTTLETFSDSSLHHYPKHLYPEYYCDVEWIETSMRRIQNTLVFLAEVHPLHWWCRRSIREAMISLSVASVHGLPLPGGLKRYILCHDIHLEQ